MNRTRLVLSLILVMTCSLEASPLDSLLELYSKSKSDVIRVDILNELSALMIPESPDSALNFARQAQDLAQLRKYQLGQAVALIRNGQVEQARKETSHAVAYYREALTLLDKQLYPSETAEAYAELGRALADLSRLDEAIDSSRQALVIYTSLNANYASAQVANEIGYRFWRLGGYDSALVYYHRSLALREHLPNRRDIAKTVNNIGVIYYQLGKYNRALEYYFRSLKIQQEIANNFGISLMLSNIGKAYQDLERYDDALYHFREALHLAESVNDKVAMAYSYNNMGTIYEQIGFYDSSLVYFQQSLEKYRDENDIDGIALNLNSIGSNYTFLGKYDKALNYLWRAHKTADSLGHTFGVVMALKNLGAVYHRMDEFPLALKHYLASMELCKTLGKQETLKNIYLEISKVYEETGEDAEALQYFRLYVDLNNSLYGEQIENNIDKLRIIYEAEKMEDENQVLRQREQEQDAIIARNRGIILIGGIALFLIMVLAFFLNYLNLSRKKAMALLTASEEKYRLLVESVNDAIVISQDHNFIYFNEQFAQMLGYSADELKGKDFQDIYAEEGVKIILARNELRKSGVAIPARYETVFKRKDSSLLHLEANVTIIDYLGAEATFAVLRDISDRKLAEDKLKASLAEKTILLQEIQHRTKNNMNVIIALLNMQERESNQPELTKAFQVTQERIAAMSLVYDQLQSKENMAAIDLDDYLRTLVEKLSASIGVDTTRIKLLCESDRIELPLTQAVPIGIILNEMITNALKYAFPDEMEGEIHISARLEGKSRVLIKISDDGVGMPQNLMGKSPNSLGLRLVDLLVIDQLGGKHDISSDGGLHHLIEFDLSEA